MSARRSPTRFSTSAAGRKPNQSAIRAYNRPTMRNPCNPCNTTLQSHPLQPPPPQLSLLSLSHWQRQPSVHLKVDLKPCLRQPQGGVYGGMSAIVSRNALRFCFFGLKSLRFCWPSGLTAGCSGLSAVGESIMGGSSMAA